MIESKRKGLVREWTKVLSARRVKSRNKFHERRSPQNFPSVDNPIQWHGHLQAELAAWEAASDEDFEAFEDSLE